MKLNSGIGIGHAHCVDSFFFFSKNLQAVFHVIVLQQCVVDGRVMYQYLDLEWVVGHQRD
jgi:hypothetical protein